MEKQLIENCMKLGFGMMRLPRMEGTKDIDLEQTKRMVDAFIEAGGKYFDTAYVYEGSEAATKASLCDRYPRESYYLADKLNASVSKSEEEAKNQIHISLERTGAGYIDFYLLHGIDEGNKDKFDRLGLWDYVKQLKQQGLIRHYGFSFHSTPGCPMDIHIPEIFAVMNVYKMYGNLTEARNEYSWRPGGEKASACVQCGQCEGACPQHLPIISLLEEVVETLEK